MSEDIRAEPGETKIEGSNREYWNTKTGGYAKKGDQVKGVLLRAEADEYKGKPTTQYVIASVDDKHEIYLPNHSLLNGMLSKVAAGRTVRIVYLGKSDKATRGRNAPELYDVFRTADAVQDIPKPAPKAEEKPIMGDYMKEIFDELKYGAKFFSEGLIPESSVMESIKAACRKYSMRDPTTPGAIFQGLLSAGRMFEPKPGFYKVVV